MIYMEKLNMKEMTVTISSLAVFITSFLILKISEFSVLSLVNLQNYFIQSMIINTAGMGTLEALRFTIQPFLLVLLSMILFVAGLSIIAAHGFRKDFSGWIIGLVSAIIVIVLFQSIAGGFFALAVFLAIVMTPKISAVYGKELKRWVFLRVGTTTIGRILKIANIVIAVGILLSVLSAQAFYENSFRTELTDSMKTIALSIPGAELLPEDLLMEQIESVVDDSPLFSAYSRWLPVSTAAGAWIILEFLRSLLLANIGGLFTYVFLKARD